MAFEFKDNRGNVVAAFKSTIPGVFLVPEGRNVRDATPLDDKVFHKRIERVRRENNKPRQDSGNLEAQVTALTKLVTDLQADIQKLMKNHNVK